MCAVSMKLSMFLSPITKVGSDDPISAFSPSMSTLYSISSPLDVARLSSARFQTLFIGHIILITLMPMESSSSISHSTSDDEFV